MATPTPATSNDTVLSPERPVSGSQRMTELARRGQHREAEELALGLSRAFGVGGFIYLLFFRSTH